MKTAVGQFARRRPVDESLWESFGSAISYVSGDFDDPAAYERLRSHLWTSTWHSVARAAIEFSTFRRPRVVRDDPAQSGQSAAHFAGRASVYAGDHRKPFGRDLASAEQPTASARRAARRPDLPNRSLPGQRDGAEHPLFRFANSIFEPLWNGKYVDHVQLTVAGVYWHRGRGNYYDQAGTLRDMVQNHIFQFMTLMAMEPPVAFESGAVHDEKVKVLRALREVPLGEVDRFTVRGQYRDGFTKASQCRAIGRTRGIAHVAHRDLTSRSSCLSTTSAGGCHFMSGRQADGAAGQ